MDLLFSCAGRRNYLLRYFREALGGTGKIIATDRDSSAPAMAEADIAEVVPEVYAPDYIDRLLDICRKHTVRAVIPLNDLDLPILACAKHRFLNENIFPVVSDSDVIDMCFDKWKTFSFIEHLGLKSPQTYLSLETARAALDSGELRFPLVVKPRWGSGSIGIEFVYNYDELSCAYPLVAAKINRSVLKQASRADAERAILIQEKIEGTEFGLDIVNDLDGRYQGTIMKRKLAMRAGETDKAVSVDDTELRRIGKIIACASKHIGNLDCDILERDGIYRVLELNPRFGGGYPFSHLAGANVPRAILAWLAGTQAECLTPRIGVTGAKFDTLLEIHCEVSASAPSNNAYRNDPPVKLGKGVAVG